METLVNAIVSGTQTNITFMGATFSVPVVPQKIKYDEKKKIEFAVKEAKKLIEILK
jgi:hypothetical protein